jgi:hypothetical protein
MGTNVLREKKIFKKKIMAPCRTTCTVPCLFKTVFCRPCPCKTALSFKDSFLHVMSCKTALQHNVLTMIHLYKLPNWL